MKLARFGIILEVNADSLRSQMSRGRCVAREHELVEEMEVRLMPVIGLESQGLLADHSSSDDACPFWSLSIKG